MTAAVSLALSLAPVSGRSGERGKGTDGSGDQFAHALKNAPHRGARQESITREHALATGHTGGSATGSFWQIGMDGPRLSLADADSEKRASGDGDLASALRLASKDRKAGDDDRAPAAALEPQQREAVSAKAGPEAAPEFAAVETVPPIGEQQPANDAALLADPDADAPAVGSTADGDGRTRQAAARDDFVPLSRQAPAQRAAAQGQAGGEARMAGQRAAAPQAPADADGLAAADSTNAEAGTLSPTGRAPQSAGAASPAAAAQMHAAVSSGDVAAEVAGAASGKPGATRPDAAGPEAARPANTAQAATPDDDIASPQPPDVSTQDKPARDRAADMPRMAASPAAERQASASPDPLAGRVGVVAAQNVPAPALSAAQVLGSTSSGLVDALAADETWQGTAREAAAAALQRPTGMVAGTNTLRIQLNPAELGMVTARLTASGSQLSVELQVESPEARQVLSRDSEQIVKALRAVGFEVDRVTIQQAQPSTGSSLSQNAAGGGRDQTAANQQQASGDGDTRRQNGSGGNDAQGGTTARSGSGEASAARSGGGVYI